MNESKQPTEQPAFAGCAPSGGSVPGFAAKELADAGDKLLVSVTEFLRDWRKGDFDLPRLAECDAKDMETKAVIYAEKLKQYEQLHVISGQDTERH